MMYRGFSYALRPTPEQSEKFAQYAGVCRLVWNLALEQREKHWRNYQKRTGDNLNYVTQARELTALRAEFDFVRDVSQTAEQFSLKNLDDAYKRFFKGLGGYPKPKKKGVHDTFTFAGREIQITRLNKRWGMVRLPKIGWVKFRWTRTPVGKFTEATISKTALGWSISIGCKINAEIPNPGGIVGIDRGVAIPVMLSDGTAYHLPRQVANLEKKARHAQRIASRRNRGSRRWAQAQRRVSAIKAKQARVRKHWAHETTTDICRHFGTVVIERLRTKNMTASAAGTIEEPGKSVAQKRGLNRAILNVGWHQIETMLFYKSVNLIKVDPKYTSQTCSACGTVDKRGRKSQASFVCPSCGFRANSDLNAAINIRNRGNTPGVELVQRTGVEARTVQGDTPLGNPGPLGPGRC